MPLSESPKAQAIRELNSTECPVDGLEKQSGHSFCQDCYFALSGEMRHGLCSTFSEDYVGNYEEARERLMAKGGPVR